jgi:hypothetical protein
LKTILRDEKSLCAGMGSVLREADPVCAANIHFARRFSGLRKPTSILRGQVSGLRGQNPLCALKNRFARAFFTLRGQKPGFLANFWLGTV